MNVLRKLLLPAVVVLNGIGNAVVRLLGIPPVDARSRLFSPEDLEYLMEESAEVGLMEADEQLFIENILDLRDRTVGQIMTPRRHVVGLSITASEQETIDLVCEERHSRYPVYNKDLDDIVGVLHAKTLARQQASEGQITFDLRSLARPVTYVPESLPLDEMLTRFRRDRRQLAVVVDEYGGTAGLVTLEDIIEEVVGEILDEFDQELPPSEVLERGLIRARGDLLVDELNQIYDLSLKHPEADTIGGLIMASLGRLAEPGDSITVEGIRFQVEAVEGRAVQTALVHLPKEGQPHSA